MAREQVMRMVRAAIGVLGLVVGGAALAPGAHAAPAAAASHAVETDILPMVQVRGRPPHPRTLAEEMAIRHVPAFSIAVADHGKIVWAKAYGLADVAAHRRANVHTLFQAASISKPVAASAAMQLVQEGKLSLDADINTELKSWHTPESAFTKSAPITLRGLLTHTAGLNVHGFPGYAAGEPIPTVVQVLDGKPPANTEAVVSDHKPGERWSYSGGGITIAQLAMTDVTGEPFPKLMHDRVLGPVGMSDSTYEQPLPEPRRGNAAHAYLANGDAVKGDWHTYPEMAAAGLWTTPTDLTKWALALQAANDGRPSKLMSQATARAMLTPGLGDWGLGVEVKGEGDARWFQHSGGNWGFRSNLIAWTEGGRVIAVMGNGDDAYILCMEATQAVARHFGWKGVDAKLLDPVVVPVAELAPLAGKYGGGQAVLALEEQTLVSISDGKAIPMIPVGHDQFFQASDGLGITIVRDASGKPTGLRVGDQTLKRDS